MAQYSFSEPSGHSAYVPVLWFATLFAMVTYAAISMRAVLNPYEANYLIDAKRFFSVAVGAFILWLSIRAAERKSDQGPSTQIFTILNIAIPGAIGLLLAREAYDLVESGELAWRLALNVRWMLNWIGYFAAAVAAFLALGYHRRLQSITAHGGSSVYPDNVSVEDTALRSTPSRQADYEVADTDFDPRVFRARR